MARYDDEKFSELEEEVFRAAQEIIYLKHTFNQELLDIHDFNEIAEHIHNAYNLIQEMKLKH